MKSRLIKRAQALYDKLISMSRGKSDSRDLSLTFDGGEVNHAKEILSILRSKEIETTIFLTGRFIKRNPELVRQMLNALMMSSITAPAT